MIRVESICNEIECFSPYLSSKSELTIKLSAYESDLPSTYADDFRTILESYGKQNTPNKFVIKKVIFNDPATIVLWQDGTKTVVKCGEEDTYDPEKGLALCFAKKAMGNKGNFNNTMKKWVEPEIKLTETLSGISDRLTKILGGDKNG